MTGTKPRLAVPKQSAERRRWQRLGISIPVFVRGVDEQGKEFLEFTTALNISAGGALLVIRRYLSPSRQVSLEIPSAPLPLIPGSQRSVKTIRARLTRVSHGDVCDLWGLKFMRPIL